MSEILTSIRELGTWLGSEFWSALVGAIVGGLIALFIQKQEQNAARRERKDDRRMEAKSHGYSLLFKVISIHSSLTNIKKTIDDRLALAKREKIELISAVLLPIANLPTPVEFSPAEMAMLLSLKNDDAFNAVVSLDKIHNSIIPIWTIYDAKRAAIPTQSENHVFDKTQGRGKFDIMQGSHFEASVYEIETLANELVRRAEVDFLDADKAMKMLVPLLNDRLKLGVGVTNKR
ncbi:MULTISPECIES: hypothetical protein [unclassified Rhizobium]|uniref:hypothetical protein n=1 Tax=unclassified Rhizobium TaxID=2613769 RepID=UPI001A9802BC|nr:MULTISPECIES: hypothetical protein [unclassified Rhizobium]MBX5170175.1 hypothetical protein [Rhizobium sp. NZLR1b]MBX5184982.1 hypothetical protein [Rhizobium sp. NZLR5]MBX5204767.1 hypothetical protein [Rhizobium sp. NZLR1]QSZ19772.1 hypothetical protein J3O30_15695 [Rhizobium sp. NZLR1]